MTPSFEDSICDLEASRSRSPLHHERYYSPCNQHSFALVRRRIIFRYCAASIHLEGKKGKSPPKNQVALSDIAYSLVITGCNL